MSADSEVIVLAVNGVRPLLETTRASSVSGSQARIALPVAVACAARIFFTSSGSTWVGISEPNLSRVINMESRSTASWTLSRKLTFSASNSSWTKSQRSNSRLASAARSANFELSM